MSRERGGSAVRGVERTVGTAAGPARLVRYGGRAADGPRARAALVLGHGAGGGVEARDLVALAAALPERGVAVTLVEQPWRTAGRKLAPAPAKLDAAWRELWPVAAAAAPSGVPVVAGGRSAGARVACRTARGLGADAVLALAFPLHPPGRPERSRAEELAGAGVPTLVVQGARDPFGRPEEFPAGVDPAVVPYGDHSFAVPKSAPTTQDEALADLVAAVARWTDGLSAAR